MKNQYLTIFCGYIILTFGTFFFHGCSGTEDPLAPESEFYMRFKVDGEQIEYQQKLDEFKLVGNFNVGKDPNHFSTITGQKDQFNNDKNQFLILISDEEELNVNTIYTNGGSSGNRIEPLLLSIIYRDNEGVQYSTVNNINLIPADGVLNAEVTYTQVDANSIQGSFSATIYNNDNNESIRISDGSFKVFRNY